MHSRDQSDSIFNSIFETEVVIFMQSTVAHFILKKRFFKLNLLCFYGNYILFRSYMYSYC